MKSSWSWLSLVVFLILLTVNVGQSNTRKDSEPAEKSRSEPQSQPAPASAGDAGGSKQPGGVSGEAGTDKKAPEVQSSGSARISPKAKDDKQNPHSKSEEDAVVVEDVKTAETEQDKPHTIFDSKEGRQSGKDGGDGFDLNSDERLSIYQKVFMEKRQRHLSAVEDMMTSYDYEQQFKLVNMVFEKMQEMYSQSRKTLTEYGFEPGMPFPGGDAKGELLEALSVLLENVAFLSDIVLRLPDISSSVYNKNRQFRDLAKWAIKFVGDTNFFDDVHKKLLDLLSQELKIVKRDPDFVNPFRREAEPVEFDTTGAHIKKKKPKKPKKRGPRMSKQEL